MPQCRVCGPARPVDQVAPEGPSGPLSGEQGPSGPLSGEGPSGPLSGEQGPSGPLSGEQGPSGPLGGEHDPGEEHLVCPTCGREIGPPVKAPWHFKLLVVSVVIYLGWRAWQGIEWVLGKL